MWTNVSISRLGVIPGWRPTTSKKKEESQTQNGWVEGRQEGGIKKKKNGLGQSGGASGGRAENCPRAWQEPPADGLGGKQRESEGGTLQEAGGKDDEGSVPQEACSGQETPLKAGSCEVGTLQEAGEGEVEGGSPQEEGGSPQEEGEVEGRSPLEEGPVEGGPPLEGGTPQEGKVEGGTPQEGKVEGGSPLEEGQEGKVEDGSPLEEGQVEGGPPLEGGTPQAGAEGVPPLDGLEGGPPPAGAEAGPPLEGAGGGPPLEGEEWAQEPDRARGPESVRMLECQEEPGGTPNSPPPL
ncbi:unnamed protein product [Boreogadus saida]